MIGLILAFVGAALSVLAFPPFGPGWLIVPGVTSFLIALRRAEDRQAGLLISAVYGLAFFGGLMWWLSELGLIAMIPLVVLQAAFVTIYGWWLVGHKARSPLIWQILAVGGWALMELVRYHFPFNGLEWGAAGYALSDSFATRFPAVFIGTSGLTIFVILISSLLALMATRDHSIGLLLPISMVVVIAGASGWSYYGGGVVDIGYGPVYVVQGSTPCPFEHCGPDERLHTFEQHLRLTRQIEDEAFLVIWSEGSTGSNNADPVLNPEIGDLIATEARRLGAWFLVGSDRPVSRTEWVNANVVFNPAGEIVDEYRKQHPVPFGEYIPFRPLFEWIPALDAVPRDMIPGDGPVVFDLGQLSMGSVISFEGGFSRYARQHVAAGADLIVVATNEGSYGTTPASDQFIGMTRMRAVELGVPVVHSAVTGKSVFIDVDGDLQLPMTDLGTMELLTGTVGVPYPTPYTRFGDWLIWSAAVAAGLTVARLRWLVGSEDRPSEEEQP